MRPQNTVVARGAVLAIIEGALTPPLARNPIGLRRSEKEECSGEIRIYHPPGNRYPVPTLAGETLPLHEQRRRRFGKKEALRGGQKDSHEDRSEGESREVRTSLLRVIHRGLARLTQQQRAAGIGRAPARAPRSPRTPNRRTPRSAISAAAGSRGESITQPWLPPVAQVR